MEIMAMAVVWKEDYPKRLEMGREMGEAHSLQGKRVLIVEDHMESAELLKRYLRVSGAK